MPYESGSMSHKRLAHATRTKPHSAPPRVKHGTGRGIRKARRGRRY